MFVDSVPKSFLFLKALVKAESYQLESPTISTIHFNRLCDSCFVPIGERERALNFLKRTANVLQYDSVPALKEILVLDTEWLIGIMTRIVSTDSLLLKRDNASFGSQDESELWPPYLFHPRSRSVILKLLESFEIIHPVEFVSADGDILLRYVVPCCLPETEPRNATKV